MQHAATIGVYLGVKSKIVDVFHGVITDKGVHVGTIDSSHWIGADPSTDFRVVIAISEIDESDFLIDSFSFESPGIYAQTFLQQKNSPFPLDLFAS